MIQLSHDESTPPMTSDRTEYERTQKQRSLFRVLAKNLVRELREGGHHGHELLDFASEVLQAITDNGWDHPVDPGRMGPNGATAAPLPFRLITDDTGGHVIAGDRVVLRAAAEADGPALRRWGDDPLIQTSLIPIVLQYVLEHLGKARREKDRVEFIVCDRSSGQAIGLVSLHDIDPNVGQAELGKMIGEPAFRGKGAAHEAARLILHYGFETLALNRVYLRTLGGNLKNIRLNERIGFRFEGVLQQAAAYNGGTTDVVLMAMLASEFRMTHGG